MSTEINKAFVQQFSGNLIHLLNQEGSMLMNTVRMDKVTGKYAHFDRLGRGTVVKRTSRHSDTPLNDTAHSRRRVILDDYEWGDLIDKQDEIRMLIDPTSDYARAAAWDLGIQVDQIIVDGLHGNALSIDSSDSSSNVALPASQIIDEDFGTGTDSNLTVEKLIEARRLIAQHAGMIRGNLHCVVNSSALHNLLGETEVASFDYNSVKALVRGEIDTFLGMKFHTVKDGILPGTADGTDTDPVLVYVYLEDAMGLAVGQDIQVRISERVDKSYATQVYACMTMGSVRIEEEKVVRIECVQSA